MTENWMTTIDNSNNRQRMGNKRDYGYLAKVNESE